MISAALSRQRTAAERAEYVRRIVDAAPPLSDEQIDRLAAIVRAGQVAEAALPGRAR